MGWFVLVFVALPLVDIWLLLAIGELVGFWPTVALTISTALIGGYLGKREGKKVLRQWRDAMAELRMPEDGLVSAALVLAGSVLLVTPGVITDTIGITLLVPLTRRPIANLLRKNLEGRMNRAVERGRIRVDVVSFQGEVSTRREPEGDVIDTEGELVEEPRALLGPAPDDVRDVVATDDPPASSQPR